MAGDTLTNLTSRIRQRADRENDPHIADAEITRHVNSSGRELWDLLIAASADYTLTSATFTLAGTTDTYALPTTLYKVRGVDWQDSGVYVPLSRFTFHNRNSTSRRLYRVMGAYLRLIPEANVAGNYRLWYEAGFVALSAGTDTLDDVLTPFDEYIVIDCAIKLAGKSEEDTSVWNNEKQAMIARITAMAPTRDEGEPDRVTDVYDRWNDGEDS